MTDDDGRTSRWGARLPAALLALAIIATAGAVLWILLSPPPGADNSAEKQETEAKAGELALKSADAPDPQPAPKQDATPEPTQETKPADPTDTPKPVAAPAETGLPAGTSKSTDTAVAPSPAPLPSPAPVPDTPVPPSPAARTPATPPPAAAPPLPVIMPRLPRAQSGQIGRAHV